MLTLLKRNDNLFLFLVFLIILFDDSIGPSALMPLQQICGSFNDGHYTYTICPYRAIVQKENQSNGYQGCIGYMIFFI